MIIDKYMAYFLGFFWGDGSCSAKGKLTTPKIIIVKEDADILFPIFNKIFPINKRESLKEGRRPQTIASFPKQKELRNFLRENDFIFKSKASHAKVLEKIDPCLHKYFWLGLSDADGCFYKKKKLGGGLFSITSRADQDWSAVLKWLKSIGVDNAIVRIDSHSTGKFSVLSVRYAPDIVRVGECFYGDGFEFGLERKYKKYLLIKDSVRNLSSTLKGIGFCKKRKKWRWFVAKTFKGYFATEKEAYLDRLKYLARIAAS